MTDHEKSVRLNFLVRPEVKETLEGLRERIGADSLTEVVRRALATYDWLASVYERGAVLSVSERDGTPRRVEMPEFSHLLPSKARR
jgi:hypothetical protein